MYTIKGSILMKLTPIAANRNVISYDDGTEVFFSYSTPVAGYSPVLGYVKTEDWYSSTTTRHINKYLGELKANEVPQEIVFSLLLLEPFLEKDPVLKYHLLNNYSNTAPFYLPRYLAHVK